MLTTTCITSSTSSAGPLSASTLLIAASSKVMNTSSVSAPCSDASRVCSVPKFVFGEADRSVVSPVAVSD
ncbi:MAG: hypothetical protein R2708_05145 [Vicinamibacterales bacterium]